MSMTLCTCKIVGTSPLGFSAPIQSQRETGETHDHFEERTWRERIHATPDGEVFITPMALKNCLSQVAKRLGETIPGKGKSTYTKHFEGGVMVTDRLMLGIQIADVQGLRLFLPSDGIRGSGKRVWKMMPMIPEWATTASIYLLDPVLQNKPDKVREYLEHAGKFVGLGYFRPANNGYWGRFVVKDWGAKNAV